MYLKISDEISNQKPKPKPKPNFKPKPKPNPKSFFPRLYTQIGHLSSHTPPNQAHTRTQGQTQLNVKNIIKYLRQNLKTKPKPKPKPRPKPNFKLKQKSNKICCTRAFNNIRIWNVSLIHVSLYKHHVRSFLYPRLLYMLRSTSKKSSRLKMIFRVRRKTKWLVPATLFMQNNK